MSDSNKCVYEDFYKWCDIYGKVNYNTAIHSKYTKIKPIAPNFAIKLWDKSNCFFHATMNYLKSIGRTTYTYRNFWRVYAGTLNRKRIIDIKPILPQNEKYIFMVGRWWIGQNECNNARAKYIEVCKNMDDFIFEGGLIPEIGCTENVKFLSEKKYSYDEYLDKTSKSLIAFNTPAYFECHGWKLPEFLCMGKAIISTPFVNELPIPLEHGKNIWFVNSLEELQEGVITLLGNDSLRHKLECGARDYWEKNCSPESAIKGLLDFDLLNILNK